MKTEKLDVLIRYQQLHSKLISFTHSIPKDRPSRARSLHELARSFLHRLNMQVEIALIAEDGIQKLDDYCDNGKK